MDSPAQFQITMGMISFAYKLKRLCIIKYWKKGLLTPKFESYNGMYRPGEKVHVDMYRLSDTSNGSGTTSGKDFL